MIISELFEEPQQCPECGGISFSDLILAEKKDACYHKVKASAKVWPSAYASGRLVQCRKKGAANWGNKSEGVAEGAPELLKQEMPLVRHIERELAQHGYEKGTPEYNEVFKHTISMYRKFGNVDAIKQGVAEGAKWRSNPDAHDINDDGDIYPKTRDMFAYDPLTRRQSTAGDARTARGKKSALKTSLKMAQGRHGPKSQLPEEQGVAEGSEKDMSKEVKAMATGKCPHCHGPVEKKEHPTLTQYHCAKCGIRASIDKQGVAEGLNQGIPSVLYHATYKPRLKSIKLKGLGAGGKRNWEDSKSGVIYLALDPNVAESYAESSDMVPDEWLDQIVILKISTAGLDSSKFSIDSNVQDNAGDTVEYHGVIPVSNISLYEQGVAEAEQQPGADYRDPKEVDYDGEYDAMVARVKKLAGLGPMKTVYDPAKRQYRNMPTAVQPKK